MAGIASATKTTAAAPSRDDDHANGADVRRPGEMCRWRGCHACGCGNRPSSTARLYRSILVGAARPGPGVLGPDSPHVILDGVDRDSGLQRDAVRFQARRIQREHLFFTRTEHGVCQFRVAVDRGRPIRGHHQLSAGDRLDGLDQRGQWLGLAQHREHAGPGRPADEVRVVARRVCQHLGAGGVQCGHVLVRGGPVGQAQVEHDEIGCGMAFQEAGDGAGAAHDVDAGDIRRTPA